MKTKLLSLIAALCVATGAFAAYDFKSGDLYYYITSDTIPYTVKVTRESYNDNYSGLTTAVIPETVTYDGITYAVTSIEDEAFSGCTGLTSVTIGNSVTSIGEYAFSGCTGLTSVTWNAKNCDVEYRTDYYDIFDGIRSRITSFTFGDEVEYISSHLCEDMSNLTSITIPNSVTSIGDGAFSDCTGLTSITIPNSVTSLSGFNGCTGLTSITIPNSVTSIGDWAFSDCTGLTSVTIGNSVKSIGRKAFSDCTGLTSITIPNSVTRIGGSAFSGCTGLTSITIPNNVTSIGISAFDGCTGLTSVTWNAKDQADHSVFAPDIFSNIRSQITSFTFGDEVEYIPVYLCKDMSKLTSVTIPNSVKSIGEGAFSDCTGLTSLTIPHSVKSVGGWAFDGCSNLSELYLGAGLETIGTIAFAGCQKLYEVYCYATNPPYGNQSTVNVFGNYNGNLHVPCESLDKYQRDAVFGSFKYILCLGADGATLPSDKVIVTSSYDNATFTWPSNGRADTYALVITKDGATFCTLTFNANGQLMGIAFAPSKDRNNAHAPQAAQATVNGWQFTVTGLSEGSNYAYTLTVTDSRGQKLQTYNGTFRTLGTTALDNINATDAAPVRKIFRNGQVLILRGNEVYTVLGEKVE